MNPRLRSSALTLAVWFVPVVFVLLPVLGFAVFSFWLKQGNEFIPALSLDNYRRWLADPIYLRVFTGTVWLALGVTALILAIGYPIAWMIHRLSGARRIVALALILAPLFMSYIVKLYALRSLFGSNGYVAQALAALGLDVPVTWLLFNQTSVFMTMAIVYLPFAVVPIFLTLEKVPANLSAAAADLGARPGQTFWRVVFPLSLPGTVAGGLFVFILALGDFVTPQMMGGTRGFTYGKLVFSQFGLAYEWPFGAAMSVVLLLVSLLVILAAALIARRGAVSL